MPNNLFSVVKKKFLLLRPNSSPNQSDSNSSLSATATPESMASAGESEARFREIYQCAKVNTEWYNVAKMVKEYPHWLTKVPEGRRWTMMHQIVFSGNVAHLKEILSYQINNPDFELLMKALDGKTIKDVAAERSQMAPQMLEYIYQLIECEKMLKNAELHKWNEVKQAIILNKDIANEKPPYQDYYLIHYLAAEGQLDVLKQIQEITPIKLQSTAHSKTAAEIANENGHHEFAAYMASLPPAESPPDFVRPNPSSPSSASGLPHHSPAFYSDLSISFLPSNLDPEAIVWPTMGGSSMFGHHSNYHQYDASSHSASHGSSSAASSHPKPAKAKPKLPSTTPEEDAAYEKRIVSNVEQLSKSEITNLIICPITKQVMRNPVIAADGFTYEHTAILKWFEGSNRSPMTNEHLENQDLKPNQTIKSLLKSLDIPTGKK